MTNKTNFEDVRKDGTATDFERVFNVNRLNILPSSVNFNRFEISYRPRRPRKSNPKHLRFKPYVNDIVFKSSNNFRRSRTKSESRENVLPPSTIDDKQFAAILLPSNTILKRAKSLDTLHNETDTNEVLEVELVSTKIRQMHVTE